MTAATSTALTAEQLRDAVSMCMVGAMVDTEEGRGEPRFRLLLEVRAYVEFGGLWLHWRFADSAVSRRQIKSLADVPPFLRRTQ